MHNVTTVPAAVAGAHGAVIGALTPAGDVDVDATKKLMAVCRAEMLEVTFHRAVDMARCISTAFERCIELGVDRVLTSGGANTAAGQWRPRARVCVCVCVHGVLVC